MDMRVAAGTIAVYTDVQCPWSAVVLHRLRQARRRLGAQVDVHIDLRLWSIEEAMAMPVSRRAIDAETPVVSELVPELHWQPWNDEGGAFPVSSLLANEAVHAAKLQGWSAAEQLDAALRQAFFRYGRCITLRHVVLDVASHCDRVDAGMLEKTLDDGTARGEMMAEYHRARFAVGRTPHLFFADGYDIVNPGVEVAWSGEVTGDGYPTIECEFPGVFDGLVRRAQATMQGSGR
jgi:predicted DsbA family dithiol-disulfide isomerase